jgi:hypothetical protein
MFVVFLSAFTFALALNDYHTFTVKPDRPFSMALDTSILVLDIGIIPSEDLQLTVVNRLNQTQIVPMTSQSHLMFVETTLAISLINPAARPHEIHFWLLQAHLCAAVSYSVIIDHRVSFQLNSDSGNSEFCVFTHSGSADSYSAFLDFRSTMRQTRIEFYTNSATPDWTCPLNSICSFSSRQPFVVRFANVTTANLIAAVSLSADRENIDPYGCDVKPIPFLVEPRAQTPIDGLSISDIQCGSMAENTLKNVGIGVSVAAAVLVVLVWMHHWGVIDLKRILLCSGETERFVVLKENPYTEPLLESAVENKLT